MLVLKYYLRGVLHTLLLSIFWRLHNIGDYTGMLATTAFGRNSVPNVDLFTVLVHHWHLSEFLCVTNLVKILWVRRE